MSQRGETTHDLEPARPANRLLPRLLLLFSGTSPLRKPFAIPLPMSPLSLGRSAVQLHPTLGEDTRMSREHALVMHDPAQHQTLLRDTKSRNGSFVNGSQVSECKLRDGDVIRLGNSLFLFRSAGEALSDGPAGSLIGHSAAVAQLRGRLARVASSRSSLLFLGETGSGKEVAARYVHELSRPGTPFVAVNCTAVPETLAESQLFGHTKGAFTGAQAHAGFFRAAGEGTLLLDEIGDLPPSLQPKLLRVLEERLIFPVGSVVGQPLLARLLFATNCNLAEAVRAGKFRADLYSRLAEIVVELPPLRERREDLFELWQRGSPSEPTLSLPASLAEALLLHSWPFNVRELVKLAAELSATGDAAAIEARLRSQLLPSPTPTRSAAQEADPRRQRLLDLLQEHKGNVAAIARILDCPRKTIYRWLDDFGIDLDSYRA